MNKKTNFYDLERSPPHNHIKHFFNWLWKKPIWIFEDFYEKHFLNNKFELEYLKPDEEIKEIELTLLRNEIQELRKQSNKNIKIN